MDRAQEQPPARRLSIEFDPSSRRIRGRIFAQADVRSFDGWMQLTARLDELTASLRREYATGGLHEAKEANRVEEV